MAGKLTRRGAALAIDYISGRAFQKTATHTTYLALLTALPTDATTPLTMTEVSATGYARQAVTWAAPAFVSSQTLGSNSSLLTFGPFTAVGGMPLAAVGAVLLQNSTGTAGDAIMYWILDTPLQAAQGDSLLCATGNMDFYLS